MRRSVIGIDEVGRGALAGPVVVAAVMINGGPAARIANASLGALKDSKQLSARQRELWCDFFNEHSAISFAVARVYPRQIEKRNISSAANLAALRACKQLVKKSTAGQRSGGELLVLLDGGLYLGKKNNPALAVTRFKTKTIIRGDEKITAIKIASIIAKVHRDRFMKKLAKKYPDYGFEVHKGYGTKLHRDALQKVGSSDAHRKTFIAKIV